MDNVQNGISDEFILTNLPKTQSSELPSNKGIEKYANTDNPIRLFVRDINLLRNEDGTLKKNLFGEQAESVLIFGDLFVYKRIERFKKGIYLLDDGTERVKVHYNHNNRFNKESVKLMQLIERKLFQAKENLLGITQYSDEIFDAMSTIKEITDDRVMEQYKYFENGIKAYVVGTPFINKSSELCISAKQVLPAKQKYDTDEICWNLTLADLYENEYDIEKV